MQEKKRKNLGPQITQIGADGKREFKFIICVNLRHLRAIPDSVVPLLLREKSDSTEKSEEPTNSIETPIHKQLTFQDAALPVSLFKVVQSCFKSGKGKSSHFPL